MRPVGTLPESFRELVLASTAAAPAVGEVKVTFYGTCTLLFDDGVTSSWSMR